MQFDTFQVACHVAGDRRMVQDINGANVQNLEQASVPRKYELKLGSDKYRPGCVFRAFNASALTLEIAPPAPL